LKNPPVGVNDGDRLVVMMMMMMMMMMITIHTNIQPKYCYTVVYGWATTKIILNYTKTF